MNEDIFNPVEYWTPDNLPDGYFVYEDQEGNLFQEDAYFVYDRLKKLDWHNLVENFHAVVHFGIAHHVAYGCRGETFQFFLLEE